MGNAPHGGVTPRPCHSCPRSQEAKLNEPILVSATRHLGPEHLKPDTVTGRPDVRYMTIGRFAPT